MYDILHIGEVVIESPDHYQTIATLSIPEIEVIIETYRQRYLKLMEDKEIMMVTVDMLQLR